MMRIFRNTKSKSKSDDSQQEVNMVANMSEADGNLIVTLSNVEHKEKMETYLNILKSDMKLDDHTKNIFTFEFRSNDNSFIIKPTNDVTIKNILEEFAAVNILPSRKHSQKHTLTGNRNKNDLGSSNSTSTDASKKEGPKVR